MGWSAGLGVVYIKQPYKGISNRVLPIPFVSYQGRHVFFQGLRAGVQRPFGSLFTVGAQAQYKFGAYDPDDSDFLRGMNEREDTVEAGPFLKVIAPGWGAVELAYWTDTLARHKGQEWEASFRRRVPIRKWTLIPSIGVNWESSRVADYYYGVEPHEAAAGRPATEISGSVHYEAALALTRPVTNHWSVFFLVKGIRLDNDVERSPIVDTQTTYRAILSASRRF